MPSSSSSTAKRWNCGVISVPPQKTPVMPAFFSEIFSQGLQQLRRGEHAVDVSCALQQRQRLFDDVLLVRLGIIASRPS